MDEHHLNKKISDALHSLDALNRATPAPYLSTRINARLQNEQAQNFWIKAGAFISRPIVAGFGVVVFIVVNAVAISSFKASDNSNAVAQSTTVSKYDFAINAASNYDIENQEP